jgi:TPP-dependent pyruvate/acetoin dehydrogenase alpha subunit
LYRDKAEVALWKKRDPIPLFRERLQSDGLLTETSWGEMEARVAEEIREAVKFAEAGSPEPVSELSRYVYSEVGP